MLRLGINNHCIVFTNPDRTKENKDRGCSEAVVINVRDGFIYAWSKEKCRYEITDSTQSVEADWISVDLTPEELFEVLAEAHERKVRRTT